MKTDAEGKRTFEVSLEPGSIVSIRELERRYLEDVLEVLGGNKQQTARVLGIDRRTLYRKLAERRGRKER